MYVCAYIYVNMHVCMLVSQSAFMHRPRSMYVCMYLHAHACICLLAYRVPYMYVCIHSTHILECIYTEAHNT